MTGRSPEVQAVIDSVDIVEVVRRYLPLHKDGSTYVGLCPFHPEKAGSLTVYPDGGDPHYHCYGCGAHGDVIRFVMDKESVPFEQALAILRGSSAAPGGNGHHPAERQPSPNKSTKVGERSYVVVDRPGERIEHVRIDFVDDSGVHSKRFVWRRNGQDGLGGLKAAELPLYGVAHLSQFSDDADLVVTEGEKACEALWQAGIAAVGTVTGANGTPSDASLGVLTPRAGRVLLWPDNDDAGRTHMSRIAARLEALGKPCFLVQWPEAPEKGDAADFAGDLP
ncbi:MAG: CHC2 zinc finger domain-containing protein, partial [Dehalococcoidia bacterium]|nr:CHC2 zinc finger domain-containing protein [Dehalococcoidia bacterium]